MRVRDDVLIVQDDMGTSGTKIYNLDYVDPISGLDLFFEATNGGEDNKSNPIESNITRIELVDGSQELWSLPGDVAYALFSQLNGAPPYEYHTGAQSDGPFVSIPIRFGRYLYDPELAFIPTRFKNPQLKVTFNEASVRAAGATGFLSDSFVLSITAHLMEEGAGGRGWLMAKMIEEYTSLGSGDHDTDMPVDYPWRLLMVRAYESGVGFDSTITAYELNCDGGKFKPFDSTVGFLVSRMCEHFRPTLKAGYDPITGNETVQVWIAVPTGQGVSAHVSTIMTRMGSVVASQAVMSTYWHDGSDFPDSPIHWHLHGWAPHNTLFIPFGRLDVIDEWFQAQSYGKVKLYQTQGNAGAEVNVCVQQLRT